MPSPSLFLGSSTTFVTLLSLLSVPVFSKPLAPRYITTGQSYQLDKVYEGSTFFDGFNFISTADPTHGFTTYVSRTNAEADGLISYGDGQNAKMMADSTTTLPAPASTNVYSDVNGIGRKSVRIESIDSWTHGLIIADIKHMPTTSDGDGCGTWPAFWTLGSGTWPSNGEFDIVEGANDQNTDFSSGHTAGVCTVSAAGNQDCDLYHTGPYNSPQNPTGCTMDSTDPTSYGAAFNQQSGSGGVYAMQWTSDAINSYYFPRSSIPLDIVAGTPDPTKWTPFATIPSNTCDIDSNFNDMRIVFDTTFCGDFGEATWSTGTCAKKHGSSCSAYVAQNPGDFSQAYWELPSLKVYTMKNNVATTTTSSTTTSSLTTTTTSVITTTSLSTTSISSTTVSSSILTPVVSSTASTQTMAPTSTISSVRISSSSTVSSVTTSSSSSSSRPSSTSAALSPSSTLSSASTTSATVSLASSSLSSSIGSTGISSTVVPSSATSASTSTTVSPVSTSPTASITYLPPTTSGTPSRSSSRSLTTFSSSSSSGHSTSTVTVTSSTTQGWGEWADPKSTTTTTISSQAWTDWQDDRTTISTPSTSKPLSWGEWPSAPTSTSTLGRWFPTPSSASWSTSATSSSPSLHYPPKPSTKGNAAQQSGATSTPSPLPALTVSVLPTAKPSNSAAGSWPASSGTVNAISTGTVGWTAAAANESSSSISYGSWNGTGVGATGSGSATGSWAAVYTGSASSLAVSLVTFGVGGVGMVVMVL